MVIRKKKCRDCGNAITHNTVCCPYCGSVDPFGYYRNTDRIVTILLALIIVVLLTTGKRLVRTVLIFTESSDQLSRATDRVPGLPASPGYVQ